MFMLARILFVTGSMTDAGKRFKPEGQLKGTADYADQTDAEDSIIRVSTSLLTRRVSLSFLGSAFASVSSVPSAV
jgi:hypothetical protein